MDLSDVVKALEDRRISVVAKRTGIHYSTINNIAKGRVTRPQYEIMRKLIEYLESN